MPIPSPAFRIVQRVGWGASGLCPFEVLGWVGSPALSGVPEGCEVVNCEGIWKVPKVFGSYELALPGVFWKVPECR